LKLKVYLVNNRNIIKIYSKRNLKIFIIISVFSISLLQFATSTYALNWLDKEWKEAGCPKSGIGKWSSDGSNIDNEKIMLIEKKRVSIFSNNKLEGQFLYKNDFLSVKRDFIELFDNSFDGEKQVFIKIRPHLIFTVGNTSDSNENKFKCLIKVFQYSSVQDAKFDKYSRWDIYQLKNTN
jgi:hypothetical protein